MENLENQFSSVPQKKIILKRIVSAKDEELVKKANEALSRQNNQKDEQKNNSRSNKQMKKRFRVVTFDSTKRNDENINFKMRYGSYLMQMKNIINSEILEDKAGEYLLGKCDIKPTEMVPCLPFKEYKNKSHNQIVSLKEKIKEELFAFVSERQPINKEQKSFGSLITKQLENELRETYSEKKILVNWFSAIGSPLDYQYGIDGWFEISVGNDDKIRIPFDLKNGNQAKSKDTNKQGVLIMHLNTEDIDKVTEDDISDNWQAIEVFLSKVIEEYQFKKSMQ